MFHALLCRLVQGNLSKIHGHKCLANGVHPVGFLNNINETKACKMQCHVMVDSDSFGPNMQMCQI